MALNYDSITAIVKKHYIPKLVDNIYESSALLTMMREDGVVIEGGSTIVQPVLFGKNTARGGYVGMEPHDVSDPETRTAPNYDYGDYYVSLVVSGQDERKVNGDNAVINLINTKMNEAELSMKDQLGTDIFTGSTYIIGLDTAIAAGTYAGIAGGTYTWWQSGVDTTAHTAANMKDSTNAAYVHTLFRTAWKNCKHMGEKPNLIVTSQEVFDIYEQTLQANARYPMTARGKFMADAGFDILEFRGIPVVVDDYCADGTDSSCYFMNTKFSPLFYHPQNNFRLTPWKVPTNADGRIAQLYFSGQIGLTNRRMFYKFTDLAN
jgi:hypothetical protein